MGKKPITLFTNLYPTPWQPNRATFNVQQYNELSSQYVISPIVPVPWLEWIKNISSIKNRTSHKNVLYFPFFNIPGLFRRCNALFMLFSILICILPAIKLARSKTVIASWVFPDGAACSLLSKVFKFDLYIQCLGSDVNFHSQQRFKRWFLKYAFKNAKAVITVSNDLEKKVVNIAPSANAVTAYNGVNFNRFALTTRPEKTFKLTFIGNLITTKGVYELLDAFELLHNKNEAYRLQIIGDGPERKQLELLATEKQLASAIQFYGSVLHSKVVDILKDSDMLVLPSYREGIPNVIMESLACGIPVVATNVGGIPEVVNQSNGVLIETYAPELILNGIEQCYSKDWDPVAIRQSISEYTWAANKEKIISILED